MTAPTEGTFLEVDEEEFTIKLLDGSKWGISPGDITMVICWSPTARITIQEAMGDDIYPYRITNEDSAGPDIIKANRIS